MQYWHDKADRLTYEQDGELKKQGLYRFYLYDKQGRLAVQGICQSCDRTKKAPAYVTLNPTAANGGFLGTGYECSVGISLDDAQVEQVNYYDDYVCLSLPFFQQTMAEQMSTSSFASNAMGLQTARIEVTNRGEWLPTLYRYDRKGNRTEEHRVLPNDTRLSTITAYTFTNKPATVSRTLTVGGKTHTVDAAYIHHNYNDRLKRTTLSVDGQMPQEIIRKEYNAADGNICRVYQGGRKAYSWYSYAYHNRRLLTEIRYPSFIEKIYYASDTKGTPRYNGNIGAVQWIARDLPGYRWLRYDFYYDGLNRLTNAEYVKGTEWEQTDSLGIYNESVGGYTLNGAITRLSRHGKRDDGSFGVVDSLRFTLLGNQLQSVKTAQGDSATFAYNANGALVSNTLKGIKSIAYDHRNHPALIQFADGSQTAYVYTAAGEKLATIHQAKSSDGATVITDSTFYAGNFLIKNGEPTTYLFEDGYYDFATASFHYFAKDHLGNIRTVTDANGNIEQVTHYYPFGSPIADLSTNAALQPYKYNGKELDATNNLNTYDYGARQYDARLGVWDRMDLYSERYYHLTSYGYCGNNPVSYTDPDGTKIWVASQQALDLIKMTLPNDMRSYVELDVQGFISNAILERAPLANSKNLQILKYLVKDDTEICFYGARESYNYINPETGNVEIMNFAAPSRESEIQALLRSLNPTPEIAPKLRQQLIERGYSENESAVGNFGGTLRPQSMQGSFPGGQVSQSPNIEVYVNGVGTSLEERVIYGTAHELYGHTYLGILGENPCHPYADKHIDNIQDETRKNFE